jgi:hypothetical protein
MTDRADKYVWNEDDLVFGEDQAIASDPSRAEPIGVSPDEAQLFWRDFDGLRHDIGATWLEYQRAASEAAFDGLLANPKTFDLDGVMLAQHDTLLASWVGTPEEPGDLYKIILAGMQAGQRSLEKEVAANPNKPRAALPISISWDMASSQALDFIRSYAFDLIKNIDDTTRANIRAAVEKYTAEGLDADWLREQIAQYLVPPGGTVTDAIRNRATLIGQTESMKAFSEGTIKRYQDAGVNEASWQTVNQGEPHPVCDRCRSVHNVKANIRAGWYSSVDGETLKPPRHPGCRCFLRAVVS